MVPQHDSVMLGNLLNSLHYQLDDIVEVLLTYGQVLRVDIISLEGREEEFYW
jgi:hypothetical protein